VVLRVAVLVVAALAIGWVLWQLRVVVLPVFIAILVCTALTPPVVALERRGVRPLLATWIVFGTTVAAIGAITTLIVPPTVEQFGDVGVTLSEGVDDVEQWLVEGPLDLDREQVRQYTRDPVGQIAERVSLPSGSLMSGARTAGEVAVGALLSVVLTFLLLKDGRRLQASLMERVPPHQRDLGAPPGRGSGRRSEGSCAAPRSSASWRGRSSARPWPSSAHPWRCRSQCSRSSAPSSQWWAPSWRAPWPSWSRSPLPGSDRRSCCWSS
jgi:hypothetical protein